MKINMKMEFRIGFKHKQYSKEQRIKDFGAQYSMP